jgi:hypothetical protein
MNKPKRFMWPVAKFYKFTPWGFVLACVWNCFEVARKPMPFAPYVFGVIMGLDGKLSKSK